jgi:hypothetical protein
MIDIFTKNKNDEHPVIYCTNKNTYKCSCGNTNLKECDYESLSYGYSIRVMCNCGAEATIEYIFGE